MTDSHGQHITEPGRHASLIAEAARLLRMSRDWKSQIPVILENLGREIAVDRVYLFQVHEVPGWGLGQTCLFDWAAPGLVPLATDARNIAERILDHDREMNSWAERRRRGEIIKGHTRDLQGYLRKDFEHQKIFSFLTVPVMVNNQWWGHIGFDDCTAERNWPVSEQAVLQTIAYLLGDAIELSTSSLVMSEATRVAMLQTAPDGSVVGDESGAILEFNPAAEAIFGRRRSGMIGRPVTATLVPPETRGRFQAVMRALRRGRGERFLGQHTETEGLQAQGGRVALEMAITEIRQGGRRLFVTYLRDLTERKRSEAEVARQRDALHQSEKMTALGSLLAGVAHELNNPLSVVIGRAVMLEEDATDPVQRERLRKLREAAERCAKVAKTFLAMARQTPAVRSPMDIVKAIHTALDLVSYPLRSSGVSVKLDLDPDLPQIIADIDQMVQVFVNLFVNADHAMRETEAARILSISTARLGGGTSIEVLVQDTGAGIKPEAMPRIFEPFFTTKSVGAGTGMGLAVSFGMITAHGGTLEAVQPASGAGACFRIVLPVDLARTQAAPAAVASQPPVARQPELHVLVVDDEPEVASLLREILGRAGNRTVYAEDGFKGLEAVAQHGPFDAIFCDLRMPLLDGRGFRKRLIERFPGYARRIAFVTGDLLSAGNLGDTLDDCPLIEKPFQARTILATLVKLGGVA